MHDEVADSHAEADGRRRPDMQAMACSSVSTCRSPTHPASGVSSLAQADSNRFTSGSVRNAPRSPPLATPSEKGDVSPSIACASPRQTPSRSPRPTWMFRCVKAGTNSPSFARLSNTSPASSTRRRARGSGRRGSRRRAPVRRTVRDAPAVARPRADQAPPATRRASTSPAGAPNDAAPALRLGRFRRQHHGPLDCGARQRHVLGAACPAVHAPSTVAVRQAAPRHLDVEDVGHLDIESLGPALVPACGRHELCRHAEA